MFGISLKPYKQFLTKNERNKVYLRKNSSEGRTIADSKYKTKMILGKNGVGVPRLIKKFRMEAEIDRFDWGKLEGNFVVKPISGYGGDGIIIIRKKIQKSKFKSQNIEDSWQMMDGKSISLAEIKNHCMDILAGKYSLHGMPDGVLLEERIKIHPMFLAITKSGTPDIRVIVYNKVPVMAMFRIPTEKSKGKANLQIGAIGLGIDLATGITTFGVEGKSEEIKKIYDFGKKKWITLS